MTDDERLLEIAMRKAAILDAVEAIEKVEERWHRCGHFGNAGEALDTARNEVLALLHTSRERSEQ